MILSDNIILPIDFICSNKKDDNCIFRALNDIEKDDIGFDIGEGTIKIFKDIISKTDFKKDSDIITKPAT